MSATQSRVRLNNVGTKKGPNANELEREWRLVKRNLPAERESGVDNLFKEPSEEQSVPVDWHIASARRITPSVRTDSSGDQCGVDCITEATYIIYDRNMLPHYASPFSAIAGEMLRKGHRAAEDDLLDRQLAKGISPEELKPETSTYFSELGMTEDDFALIATEPWSDAETRVAKVVERSVSPSTNN